MRQCPACGKQLGDDMRFCTGCGADLSAASTPVVSDTAVIPPVAATPPAPVPQAPGAVGYATPAAAPPKRSCGVVVAIVAAVLVVLLLCCGVGGYFGYRYYRDRIKGDGSGGTVSPTDRDDSSAQGEDDTAPVTDSDPGTSSDTAPSTPPGDITDMADLWASSTLGGYSVQNLVDGDSTTCWAEGAAAYGPGQRIRFSFPREVWVSNVRVIPGYDKYDYGNGVDRWDSNGRVKGARLHFSDGKETDVFTFDDNDRGLQDMTLDEPRKVSWVEFEIIWVYPADTGTRHDAADTSISEMRVEGWAE